MIEIRGCRNPKEVRAIIELYLQDWDISIYDDYHEDRFIYKIKVENDIEEDFYRILADALEEIMIEEYLDSFIYSRINKIFAHQYLETVDSAVGRIKREIKTSSLYLDEKIKMKEDLTSYIEEVKSIDIEGYMYFRLIDYVYILDIAIDKIMSVLKEEIRVKGFIEMIKYLVQTHSCKESILNVIIDDNDFVLKDAENNIVGLDIIEKIKKESSELNPKKYDIILGVLIIMAPKRVVLHTNKKLNTFFVKTLKGVFEGSFVLCNGCNICKLNSTVDNGGRNEKSDS